MTRPARLIINESALLHNLQRVHDYAPNSRIHAMVKANAYGHGLTKVARVLAPQVTSLGVACIEEALHLRAQGIVTPIILMEGIFQAEELAQATHYDLAIMLHNTQQLAYLVNYKTSKPLKVWLKCNTGMNRLGFLPAEILSVIEQLRSCPWVIQPLNLMTHFACADEVANVKTQRQIDVFQQLTQTIPHGELSMANSAAIIAWQAAHVDVVRPGIMLYGISPFSGKIGKEFGLQPVMSLQSQLIAIQYCKPGDEVGYGGIWQCHKPSIIGVVAIGYGDGYPRHVAQGTPVLVNGQRVPLVGRVAMDMLTVDLSNYPQATIGDPVELWGNQLPVEEIAACAATSAYEIVCQMNNRVREKE